jgi:hypothetical protein
MATNAAFDAPVANAAAVEAEETPFTRAGFNPQDLLQKTQGQSDRAGQGDMVLVQHEVKPTEAPQEMSPAQKLLSETTTALQKEIADRKLKNGTVTEADLREIVPKYFPKMKEAITLADTAAINGRKLAADEYLRVKPDLEKFADDFPKAVERLGKASNAVPEADAERTAGLLSELTEEKTAEARKAEIRKDLSKYPDLAESTEAFVKLSKDAETKFGKLYQGVSEMQAGLAEGLAFRGFYLQCLNQSSFDTAEIERVKKEGEAVAQLYVRAMQAPQTLFMPPEDLQPKKPLPPTLRA